MKKTAHPRTGAREHTWAIIVLIVALLAIIAAGSYYGAGDERDRYVGAFMLTSESDARKLGEHAAQSFRHVDLALKSAAETVEAAGRSRRRRQTTISRGLRKLVGSAPQIHSITVTGADGTIRHSSSKQPTGRRLSIDPALQAFLKNDVRLDSSLVHSDPISGKKFITITRRMTGRRGRYAGAVIANVRPSYFSRFYGASGKVKTAVTALITRDGTVLASHPPRGPDGKAIPGRRFTDVPFLKDLPALDGAAKTVKRFATENTVGSVHRVGKRDLFVAVMSLKSVVLAPWRNSFTRKSIIIGCIALLICGFLLVLWWQFVQRARSSSRLVLQSAAIESAPNAMFITDRNGTITWTNAAFTEVSGYSQDEVIGRNFKILRSGKHSEQFYEDIWKQISRGDVFRGQMINRHKNGQPYAVNQTTTPIRAHGKQITHFVTVHEDITARVSAEQKVLHLAHHDALTDMSNRNFFIEQIEEAMARVERTQKPFAVLMLDIDRFKDVNDTMGHEVGDELLILLSKRLTALLRKTDMAARLGGDEFGVLLDFLTDEAGAGAFADRLLHALGKPFEPKGKPVTLTGTIGISVYTGEQATPDVLLRNAESAMYEAKKGGRGSFRFFDSELDKAARERIETGRDLKDAIAKDQFWLALQPQIDMRTGAVTGAEALLRWSHPDRGMVSPGLFIPVAEANRSILEIDDWVMREACRELRALDLRNLPGFVLGINLSAMQYEQHDLVQRLTKILKEHKLTANMLEVEITETAAMSHSEKVAANVQKLEHAGVRVAIDDFGTGYSSLSYLRDFPVSRLKIDSSFVWGIGENPRDEAIVEAVVALGHKLDLRVLAEGVETAEQIEFLRRCGCDEMQGFFICKPVAAEQFAKFVESYKPLKDLGATGSGKSSRSAKPGKTAKTAKSDKSDKSDKPNKPSKAA